MSTDSLSLSRDSNPLTLTPHTTHLLPMKVQLSPAALCAVAVVVLLDSAHAQAQGPIVLVPGAGPSSYAGFSVGVVGDLNADGKAEYIVGEPRDWFFGPMNTSYWQGNFIVFDGDTGAYKRMWGAFGNEPLDVVPEPPKVPESARVPARELTDDGPQQFVNPIHAVRVSNDGLVYVSDRGGKRVQVFTLDGKYQTQVFIDRYCEAPHCGNGQTVASTAFSHDPEQKFLYVASRSPARLWILDRKTLTPLDSMGRNGIAPGEFYVMHHMNVDKAGNLYVTEVQDGRRVQKFKFMGYKNTPGS